MRLSRRCFVAVNYSRHVLWAAEYDICVPPEPQALLQRRNNPDSPVGPSGAECCYRPDKASHSLKGDPDRNFPEFLQQAAGVFLRRNAVSLRFRRKSCFRFRTEFNPDRHKYSASLLIHYPIATAGQGLSKSVPNPADRPLIPNNRTPARKA